MQRADAARNTCTPWRSSPQSACLAWQGQQRLIHHTTSRCAPEPVLPATKRGTGPPPSPPSPPPSLVPASAQACSSSCRLRGASQVRPPACSRSGPCMQRAREGTAGQEVSPARGGARMRAASQPGAPVGTTPKPHLAGGACRRGSRGRRRLRGAGTVGAVQPQVFDVCAAGKALADVHEGPEPGAPAGGGKHGAGAQRRGWGWEKG